MECVILQPENFQLKMIARMAELVDAADSKSAVRKDVQVRFLFRAHNHFERSGFFMPLAQKKSSDLAEDWINQMLKNLMN